jgi:hypothetical protein
MTDFLFLFTAIVIPLVVLGLLLFVLVFMISWIKKKFFSRGRSSTRSENDQINHKHQQEVDMQLEKMKIQQNEVLRRGQSRNRRF